MNPSSVNVIKNRPSGSSTAEEIYNCQTIWEFPVITGEGDLEGGKREILERPREREREREICIRFLVHIAKERVDLQTEAVVRPCLIQTGASATSVWKSYISIGFSCECCTGSAKDLRPAP